MALMVAWGEQQAGRSIKCAWREAQAPTGSPTLCWARRAAHSGHVRWAWGSG